MTAQSAVFPPPRLRLCWGSRGKESPYPGLCQRVHLPSRWITLAFYFWDINAIQYTLSVFNFGTKKMLVTAQFGQCYPKRGMGGSKTTHLLSLYYLDMTKGNYGVHVKILPWSHYPSTLYRGRCKRQIFPCFFFKMHKQPQSDCVLWVLYLSDQSHRSKLPPTEVHNIVTFQLPSSIFHTAIVTAVPLAN